MRCAHSCVLARPSRTTPTSCGTPCPLPPPPSPSLLTASLATSSKPQWIAHNLSTADTLTYEVAAGGMAGQEGSGSRGLSLSWSIRLCPFVPRLSVLQYSHKAHIIHVQRRPQQYCPRPTTYNSIHMNILPTASSTYRSLFFLPFPLCLSLLFCQLGWQPTAFACAHTTRANWKSKLANFANPEIAKSDLQLSNTGLGNTAVLATKWGVYH